MRALFLFATLLFAALLFASSLCAATPNNSGRSNYSGRPTPKTYNAPDLIRDEVPFVRYESDDHTAPYRRSREEWTCIPERVSLPGALIDAGRPLAEPIGIASYALHNGGMIITHPDRNFTYATLGFLWTPAGADELTVAFGVNGERKWPDDYPGLLVRLSNADARIRVEWNDGKSIRGVHQAPLRFNREQRSHYVLMTYHFNRLTVRVNAMEGAGPVLDGVLPREVQPTWADPRRIAIYNHSDDKNSFASAIGRLDIRSLRTWQTESEKRLMGPVGAN